jgi:hypothetical protein
MVPVDASEAVIVVLPDLDGGQLRRGAQARNVDWVDRAEEDRPIDFVGFDVFLAAVVRRRRPEGRLPGSRVTFRFG